jgi:hypothetical protein
MDDLDDLDDLDEYDADELYRKERALYGDDDDYQKYENQGPS